MLVTYMQFQVCTQLELTVRGTAVTPPPAIKVDEDPASSISQARTDTRVEPPTFHKSAGTSGHPKWDSNLQRLCAGDLTSTTGTTRSREPLKK